MATVRGSPVAWQSFYTTARWRRLRKLQLIEHPLCKFCLQRGIVRKLRLRLGGDPADDEYPDKPPRMGWATYNRLMDRLVAADGVADELAARLLGPVLINRPGMS